MGVYRKGGKDKLSKDNLNKNDRQQRRGEEWLREWLARRIQFLTDEFYGNSNIIRK